MRKRALDRVIEAPLEDLERALFSAMTDREGAPDDELPDTGVGLAMERALAPPFIVSPVYGTRATTVVVLGHALEERAFGPSGDLRSTARFPL